MSTYIIIFNNSRGVDGRYTVSLSPPRVSPPVEVYTTVWLAYDVAVGASFNLQVTTDFYAVAGKTTTPLIPSSKVAISDVLPVRLRDENYIGTRYQLTVKDGEASLESPYRPVTPETGAFGIITAADLVVPNNNHFVGIGLDSEKGFNATAVLFPDNETSIIPVPKFCISESQSVPGTVVDLVRVSAEGAHVDFTCPEASGASVAVVTHNPDGSFDVVYSDPVV